MRIDRELLLDSIWDFRKLFHTWPLNSEQERCAKQTRWSPCRCLAGVKRAFQSLCENNPHGWHPPYTSVEFRICLSTTHSNLPKVTLHHYLDLLLPGLQSGQLPVTNSSGAPGACKRKLPRSARMAECDLSNSQTTIDPARKWKCAGLYAKYMRACRRK